MERNSVQPANFKDTNLLINNFYSNSMLNSELPLSRSTCWVPKSIVVGWCKVGWCKVPQTAVSLNRSGEKVSWKSLWVKIKAVQQRKPKAVRGSKAKILILSFSFSGGVLGSGTSKCVVITLEHKCLTNKSLPWSLTFIFLPSTTSYSMK